MGRPPCVRIAQLISLGIEMEGLDSISKLPFDEVFVNVRGLKKRLVNCLPWREYGIAGPENPIHFVREMANICRSYDWFIEKVGVHKESGTVVFLCDEFDVDLHVDAILELGLQAYYIDGQTAAFSFFALTSQRNSAVAIDLRAVGTREYHKEAVWAQFPYATCRLDELQDYLQALVANQDDEELSFQDKEKTAANSVQEQC